MKLLTDKKNGEKFCFTHKNSTIKVKGTVPVPVLIEIFIGGGRNQLLYIHGIFHDEGFTKDTLTDNRQKG